MGRNTKALKGSEVHKDSLGNFLAEIRNSVVSREVEFPLLDLACGKNLLVKRLGKGVGVDIIDYGGADQVVSNFNNLPFSDKSFRTVTVIASLNYFSKPLPILREIRRIMYDDGFLIITMSNYYLGNLWHKFRDPWAHSAALHEKNIIYLLKEAGYQLIETQRFLLCLNKMYKFVKADAKS